MGVDTQTIVYDICAKLSMKHYSVSRLYGRQFGNGIDRQRANNWLYSASKVGSGRSSQRWGKAPRWIGSQRRPSISRPKAKPTPWAMYHCAYLCRSSAAECDRPETTAYRSRQNAMPQERYAPPPASIVRKLLQNQKQNHHRQKKGTPQCVKHNVPARAGNASASSSSWALGLP